MLAHAVDHFALVPCRWLHSVIGSAHVRARRREVDVEVAVVIFLEVGDLQCRQLAVAGYQRQQLLLDGRQLNGIGVRVVRF